MKVEIITTGDEVMQGVIVNTNASWIAAHLAKLGIDIVRHSSVRDDIQEIGMLLKEAQNRANCVVVTGGLGPTADDLTIEAAALAFDKKLIEDKFLLESMHKFFEKVGRPYSPSNDKQALLPEGGKVLENRVGTAPGVQVKLGNAVFFFLPGVPKELYQIFEDSCLPWLEANKVGAIKERTIRCFGIPEASIDEKLRGLDLGDVRLSFRVKFPETLLKVVARANTLEEAESKADFAVLRMKDKLGEVVYAENDEELPAVLGRLLKKKKMTLAVAESCTGGLIASEITDVSGASEYFERGVVCYSNRSKQEILGVRADTLEKHGAVSSQTAAEMANGIKKLSGASIGLSVTGIAGPTGGTESKPVGTVFIGVATDKETKVFEYQGASENPFRSEILNPSSETRKMNEKSGGVARSYVDGFFVKSDEVAAEGAKLQPKRIFGGTLYNRDRLWFKKLVAWTAINLVRKCLSA